MDIDTKNIEFNTNIKFKKNAILKETVNIATEDQILKTIQKESGSQHIEIENKINKGDYIIDRGNGDKYGMSEEKFHSLYEGKGTNVYIPKTTVYAKQIDHDFAIIPTWSKENEKQNIKSGGYVLYNLDTKDIYGIAQTAFIKDYSR